MKLKVAVLAGTPVDTAMGVEFLRKTDPEMEVFGFSTAEDAHSSHLFQLTPQDNKRAKLTELFSQAEALGVRDFFIYCNSLSGVFDFESFAAERKVRVYTPLQVYRSLGSQYMRCAVLAANNQSTAGIERSLYENNPDISVNGVGYLELVRAVESGMDPEKIVRQFGLDALSRYFEQNRMDCLILGCTHFPWFADALGAVTSLPIIDPASVMYRNLISGAASSI